MEEKYLGKPSVHIISPYESVAEGRGTRNIALAKLIGVGHECTLVCTRFSHGKKEILHKKLFKNNSNFKVSTLFTIKYSKNISIKRMFAHWVTAFSLLVYFLKNAKPNDKVLVSSIPPEVLLITMLMAKFKRLDVTLDVRDIWPDAFPAKGAVASMFNIYCKALYKIAFSFKNIKVIYVAPSFKTWINRYVASSKINECIFGFLGYDKERWSASTNYLSCKPPIKLIYIGYLESQFDIENVILSVLDNELFEFVIVGNGSKLNYYKKIARDSKRIFFKGLLSLEAAAVEVSKCQIGMLPISHTAQMPNKLFDYLGSGLPIFTVGHSDSSQFVIREGFGWFSNNSHNDITRVLNQMKLEDVASFKSNVMKCRSRYSKEASYDDIITTIFN
jgi:hypothetical protein